MEVGNTQNALAYSNSELFVGTAMAFNVLDSETLAPRISFARPAGGQIALAVGGNKLYAFAGSRLRVIDPMSGNDLYETTIGEGNTHTALAWHLICNSIADTNHDGTLTPADFTAWIALYHSQDALCDQNNDGLCSPANFTAWIANYNAGCK